MFFRAVKVGWFMEAGKEMLGKFKNEGEPYCQRRCVGARKRHLSQIFFKKCPMLAAFLKRRPFYERFCRGVQPN